MPRVGDSGSVRFQRPGLAVGLHRGPGQKKALAEVYRASFTPYLNLPKQEYGAGDVRDERKDLVTDSAKYLADYLHEVPVMLIPCLQGRVEKMPAHSASFWASLLPAAWSFMLALRSRGLGSSWTALHLHGERAGGRDRRHPVRAVQPGRPVSDRLHQGHRLPPGHASARRQNRALGPLVTAC